jgi:hypothetical protein
MQSYPSYSLRITFITFERTPINDPESQGKEKAIRTFRKV